MRKGAKEVQMEIQKLPEIRNNANERRGRGGKRHAGMVTELAVNLSGDADHRRAGQSADGEFACFECGDTTHFRGDCVIYLARRKNAKGSSHESQNGGKQGKEARNGRKIRGWNEIVAISFDFRKLEMVLIEMRRLIRGKTEMSA